jgi:hypothetical protein
MPDAGEAREVTVVGHDVSPVLDDPHHLQARTWLDRS